MIGALIFFYYYSPAYCYLINFFFNNSFRKIQYITFIVQNKAIVLIYFTIRLSCSFFLSFNGYAAPYLQVNLATKIEK